MFRLLIPAVVLAMSGCTTGGPEPVPGSITYGGAPSRLSKAPVGSPVEHRFRDQFGDLYGERYIVQPDRSLKLVSRYRLAIPGE